MKEMTKDFRIGYIHGLEARDVDSRDAFNADEYYNGYIFGTNERANENIVMPEWMSPEQATAVKRLYSRSSDGSQTREEFFKRVQNYGDYCGLGWNGMFLGIEKDGYTHS